MRELRAIGFSQWRNVSASISCHDDNIKADDEFASTHLWIFWTGVGGRSRWVGDWLADALAWRSELPAPCSAGAGWQAFP